MTDSQLLDATGNEIAVIGMSGRFPGARNIAEYWSNLRAGVESIRPLTEDELERAGVPRHEYEKPNYVRAAAVLDGFDRFDGEFFGFTPKDASILDPQHRLFLECSWEALEHAGYAPDSVPGAVGVYAGSGMHGYMAYNLLRNPELMESVGLFLVRHTGNDKDFLTTRLSYLLNLKGPSINVQTACSTSLVAVHLGCQSILNGECDVALAGGVTVELPHARGYVYEDGEILSPDGHCRAFDAESRGTVFGSGVGVVVLKRLADAVADGDSIHAVIRGSAINNDGSQKVGYLAPSVDGQAAAVSEAIAVSGVPADTITYVEAHGTGTAVGDPIEIAALTAAYRTQTQRSGFCGVGSVKTNIGHLDTAAGVASLIKTIQALKHEEIPPSLHYSAPNALIDFESSPFRVNAALRPWTTPAGTPRRAGVNSLGVGGTNAHVVVEEAPRAQPSAPSRPWQLLPLSARTGTALDAATDNLIEHLKAHPEQPLADVAWTLQVGRTGFAQRRAVAVQDAADAMAVLGDEGSARIVSANADGRTPAVAFMFAGGGAQYPGMGADLYRTEPVFRDAADECLALLEAELDFDLRALLYPAAGDETAAAERLEQPSAALPALFLTQYAQAKLWQSWGITPSAMIGHSMGEYTAACIAGVFTLRQALALVSLRGRLFEQVSGGGMLSVPLPREQVEPLLGSDLSIAAVNAPELCVVSGPVAAIADIEQRLLEDDIETRRIHIAVAAHSSMLEPILPEFGEYLRGLELNAPTLPLISNVTGTWMTAQQATDPDYWVRHLRQTVRFADGLTQVVKEPDLLLLEVGPGRTLCSLARQHPARSSQQAALSSIRHPDEPTSDVAFMLTVLGQLWTHGVNVDWPAFHGSADRRRVPLPTYPFERRTCWIDASDAHAAQAPAGRRELRQWFYQSVWKPVDTSTETATVQAELPAGACAIVFADTAPLCGRLTDALRERGMPVVTVRRGARYVRTAADEYELVADAPEQYRRLLSDLGAQGMVPVRLAFCWGLDSAETGTAASWQRDRSVCFDSLLGLAQALAEEDLSVEVPLLVLTSGMQQVSGEEVPHPMRALMLGPVRVLPREVPFIRARSIDVALPIAGSWQETRLVERLLEEFEDTGVAETIAYRGQQRLTQVFEPLALPAPAEAPPRVRAGGTYLITGGLGGIGLSVAAELTRSGPVNLVLVGRTALPPRAQWSTHAGTGPLGRTIASLLELESLGATVMVATGDVTLADDMRRIVADARREFGAVSGVIHAAGTIDDGLIQLKTAETAAPVLAPKVLGTLVLDEVLSDVALDFFIVFSSISAFVGLPGQVDYAAANAFLDAFAQHRSARTGEFTLAVNWSAWQDVGMAARLAARAAVPEPVDTEPVLEHPLFDALEISPDGHEVFRTTFAPERQWLLGEHRLRGGDALIPGTGYLELVRAALMSRPQQRGVEISDVFFLSPFVVPDGTTRELELWLRRGGDAGEFMVLSPAPDAKWHEHVRGRVGWTDQLSPAYHDIEAISRRCDLVEEAFLGNDADGHLDFGPRWDNRRTVRYGRGEALAALELPEPFADDLLHFALHPALLDMATAGAQALIPGFDAASDFYVPIGYTSLRFRGEMPRTLFSHVRIRDSEQEDVAVFDVTVLDTAGMVVVDIVEFMMKRIEVGSGLDAARPISSPQFVGHETHAAAGVAQDLSEAIRPDEGSAAFQRLLQAPRIAQVAVSPHDLAAWIEQNRAESAAPRALEPEAEPLDPLLVEELRQAERALTEHPAIAAAVVAARPDRTGELRRVAYVVHDPLEHATVSELRRFLKAALPQDLVPSTFVELDALPAAGRSGDIDLRELPDPFGLDDGYIAPSTPMQKTLAQIWQEVLGQGRVGIHDNFFDIGGHSLLAMRVVSKLDRKTGIRLDNAIMVLHTLEQIAAECDRRAGTAPSQSETPGDCAPAVAAVAAFANNGASGHDAGAPADDEQVKESRLASRILNSLRQTVRNG